MNKNVIYQTLVGYFTNGFEEKIDLKRITSTAEGVTKALEKTLVEYQKNEVDVENEELKITIDWLKKPENANEFQQLVDEIRDLYEPKN